MKQKKSVIIVAGGKGLRMKSDVPKQFMEIAGLPVLMHTIQLFYNYDKNIEIILVLPEEHFEYWKDLCTRYQFTIQHQLTIGGTTRFDSVLHGLNATTDTNLIAIHDGVRPLVDFKTIDECFCAAAEVGAAIPIGECIESLREINESNSFAVDRSKFKTVQTPQVFKSELIKQAYEQAFSPLFTDDASVIETYWKKQATNHQSKITLINGNTENIKITTQIDLLIAEILLNKKNAK